MSDQSLSLAQDRPRGGDGAGQLGEVAHHQVVLAWNDTRTSYPAQTIHELFEARVKAAPEAVAVVRSDRQMSYRELNRRANRLAHHLRADGVGPEVCVGLCVERSLEMVVAILAILKAGGVYVPLDPGYPAERLVFMLEDVGAPVLVTEERLRDRLPSLPPELRVISLDRDQTALAHSSSQNPAWTPSPPDALAYVIYTSGSTGTPKGVSVTHRGVVRLVRGAANYAALDEGEVFLQLAPISFDASTLELWAPLLNGGRLVVFPPHTPSLEELGAVVARHRVTTLWLTTGLFNQMVDENLEGLRGLRQLLTGGEVLSVRHFRRALDGLPDCKLTNAYGPTESTTFTTCAPMRTAAEIADSVSIGRPISNTRVYVLDQDLRPVPAGEPGELLIAGDGLARGYLKRPRLTAERFVSSPRGLGEDPGTRLYRTGDMVRHLADGRLEFLGRRDFQVKVRGFRIELGEIEVTLGQHPGVRDAAVVAGDDGAGGKRLLAFVVPEAEPPAPGDLRRFLRQTLPDYMVPAAFVPLDALPLNPNGKVDRAALARRAPESERPELEAEYVAPRVPVEEVLAGLCCKLLGLERVGVHDSFFELGGHSLLAGRLVSQLRRVLGVEVPLVDVFEHPTVAGLAEIAGRAGRAACETELPPVERVARDGPLPLSFPQERVWFLHQLTPESIAYNFQMSVWLWGGLRLDVLARTLSEIVRRHEILHTRFPAVEGRPVQVVEPAAPIEVPVVDLRGLSAEQREAVAEELMTARTRIPFDVTRLPLICWILFRLEDEYHQLFQIEHHFVHDGWSVSVFLRELRTIYEAYAAGRPSPLPELPVQFADFAAWQRRWMQGPVLERQLGYWTKQLAGVAPVLELPSDRPRPETPGLGGEVRRFPLPDELYAALRAFSRSHGSTLFMSTLAAFYALLYRYTGQRDLALGTGVANRRAPESEALIGMVVNTVVLRGDLDGDPRFRELLDRVRRMTLEAYAHQDMPFERLVRELQPERVLSHNPLFQVMFSFHDSAVPELDFAGIRGRYVVHVNRSAKTDHNVVVMPRAEQRVGLGESSEPDQALVYWEYSRDMFDATTVERMIGHYLTQLRAIVADSERRLSELPLLPAVERHQLLVEWNDTAAADPGSATLHQRFESQVAATPEAVAVVFDEQQVSYHELNRRANRLAHSLRARGVGPEVPVGICIRRTPEMVVGILGILKAGGAYLPLDPNYPRERLAFMLADSAAPVVVTEERLLGALPEHRAQCVCLPETEQGPMAEDNPGPAATAANLAYLIYTSGSTGRAKGVAIEHRSVAVLVDWARRQFSAQEVAVVLAATSICFDLSVFELFVPLTRGSRVIVAEDALALPALAAGAAVTLLNIVPSALRELLRLGAVPASVRTVNLGGEAAAWEVVTGTYQYPGVERVLNLYGPTEDTVYSAIARLEPGSAGALPIGRPLADTRAYVLDRRGRPAPPGVPGELYLAGAGLARGYLERPALTAERFVPDPFSEQPERRTLGGRRLYRTGDLVRTQPDGVVAFLGRLDYQVKIRGFRIELGEIESVLAGCPGVRETVTAVREDQPGNRRLVAYVAGDAGLEARAGELRAQLAARLPDYMVPAALVFLDALPLTPNGKVNRAALPAPEPAAGVSAREWVAPRSPLEEMVAGIWSQLLGIDRVGVHDDFFALGGHSLLGTRLISRLRRDLQVEVPLRLLFRQPTVAGVAACAAAALRRGEVLGIPPLGKRSAGEASPLSFAQQRLWFLDRFEPGSPLYNLPSLLRLSGPLDRRALARALGEIVRRHEVLRTTFEAVDGVPVQVIRPAGDFSLPLVDLRGIPDSVRPTAVDALARREARRPFDLGRGPVLRLVLLRLGARREEHALLFTVHHIAFDGWSAGVFLHELRELYQAFSSGRAAALPELEVQYSDFAAWQQQWLRGEVLDRQLAYWRRQLAGLPVLELPVDRPRPAVQSFRGTSAAFALRPELANRLRELSRARETTLFMTLVAAFQLLLGRYAGRRDLAVGSPVANRNRAEIEPLLGFFVNTLVLRGDLRGDPTFGELLARAREAALGAYAHQDLPFEKLVEELEPDRDLSQSPLVQVLFALQNAPMRIAELTAGLQVEIGGVPTGVAKFDLTLALIEEPEGIRGAVVHNTELFDATTIRRLIAHLKTLLAAVVADSERRLSELPWLTVAEQRQLLVEWNDTASAYPGGLSIARLFELRAAQVPEAVAVVFDDELLSYAELNRRANRLAHYLLARITGGPEPMVALMMERSPRTVVAILAILKAGGVYVPLDLSYPPERLAFMLEDAEAPVLITEQAAAASLPAEPGVGVVCLDRDGAAVARSSDRNPPAARGGDHLAYVIYTSGSTGRPKGVAVSHRAVARLVFHTNYVDLGPDDRVAQASTTSFDAATFELWGALLHGGRLVGIGKDVAIDPHGLAAALRERAITALFLTTALFNQVVREDPYAFSSVRHLLFGGEAVDPHWVREALAVAPPERLLHVYGPTESTTFTTWYRVREVAAGARTVPIGGPLNNTALCVVDRTLAPVPVGVAGELLIGGDGLARGYLKRPGLTAEHFVPNPRSMDRARTTAQKPLPDSVGAQLRPVKNPFARVRGGERFYRTGDLVRYLPGGAIEFLGRLDFQVKVRGLRIELGEIEAVLGRHPAVREVVVTAEAPDPEHAGDRRLVAYVAAEPGATPAELRELLLRTLPEYMAPAAFVLLEALPLGPTGKVDRRALPAPGPSAFEAPEHLVAPRGPLEEVLAGIFSEVLAAGEVRPEVGAHDDFFALGGHSLLAIRVQSRVRRDLGIELPLRLLFERPTVAGLAAFATAALRRQEGLEAPSLRPFARRPGEAVPLSFAQQRLWFIDHFEPGLARYAVPTVLRLAGRLDPGALARALGEIVRRHEVLRTTYETVDGEPVQVIHPAGDLLLPLVDLQGIAEPMRRAAADALVHRAARRPFDLAHGPVLRVVLLRLKACSEHALYLNVHHVAFDGWSLGVLLRELRALYEAFSTAQPSPLPELAVQYADFTVWQRQWLQGEVLDKQLAWWRRQLAGLPVLELPWDRPRPAVQSFRGAVEKFRLTAALSRSLAALGRQQGTTVFMTLLASFQALVGRSAGQRDFAVGSPIANRNRAETEPLVGLFVNTLALRADLSGDPSFAELLVRTRDVALGAYAHQDLPFEKLVEELRPERDLSRSPLVQVFFVLQNVPMTIPKLAPGLEIELGGVATGEAKFDLTLALIEDRGALQGVADYNVELFDRVTIRRLLRRLEILAAAVGADPERPISQLSLLAAAERQQLLVEWNDTAAARPRAVTVHELFAARVEAAPEAVAVVCGAQQVSYGELHRRAERLARSLRARGVGPERTVGICMERSPEMVTAILGVVGAGGAYLPMDPESPPERLAFMVADAGVFVVLTREGLAARIRQALPESGVEVMVPDLGQLGHGLGLGGGSEDLAYVIYTSGSTGRPKGTEITHGGLVNLVTWHQKEYRVTADDRATQLAGPGFDAAVWELWPYLTAGAAIHIPSPEIVADPAALPPWLAARGITLCFLPTPLAEAALAEPWPPGLRLRALLTGGDRLHRAADRDLPFALVNHYGPTENTVVTTWTEVVPGAHPGTPPIGRPLANHQVRLLDAGLGPVPIGVAGELHASGCGLARGYLRRPQLTAEKFIPCPFGEQPGQRLYKTGDLARFLPDGTIEFLGRIDHQVKIRGFRIELGEVESALGAHPAVREAVVVPAERGEDQRLVAHLVAETGELDPGALRAWLGERLPEYMVPATLVTLEELPLTPNRKVDRAALGRRARSAPAEAARQAPRSEVEQRIAAVWREILELDEVGVEENFFDLGGHSLLLARVRSQLRRVLERDLPIVDLFQYPTIRSLARHLVPEPAAVAAAAPRREAGGEIAVVGMAGRFPGAQTIEAFWRNLCAGVESITFFSDDELLARGVDPAVLDDPYYVKARGVVDGADDFDADFFAMTPREALLTDPQHRLFLECAWEALERAGYDPRSYQGRIGVFAGAGANQYQLQLLSDPRLAQSLDKLQLRLGTGNDFLASRVAYKLNLKGPAMVVQTACSTSLVAVHLACESLLRGRSDVALAGAAAIDLDVGYRYQKGGIMSPDGHCRAFDARAQGAVGGSGVGIVVLKRLADALADGDVVHAVIRGSETNNDGAVKVGYTAPGVEGQAAVIRAALELAGVEPESIGYLEAHGTGTELGDPVELRALQQAFGNCGGRKGFCALGSVKTNVGHLDAAAGVAGLIKAVLALEHRQIPPSLHFQRPNPALGIEGSPFYVAAELSDWPAGGGRPRRAGVSSFGIGGTNAHAVVEEAPATPESGPSRPWQLLMVSARTPAALERSTERLAEHLEANPASLADVAHTLRVGRHGFAERRITVCRDREDAVRVLRGEESGRLLSMAAPAAREVAFLLPGIGEHYPGMGAGLYAREAVFREAIERCAELARPHLGRDLRRLLFPEGTEDRPAEGGLDLRAMLGRARAGGETSQELERTRLLHPAVFALEYALAKLWMSWGIRPAAMLGHSLGEYVAACLAGVFPLADALELVCERARLIDELPGGAMLAVTLPEDQVRAYLGAGLSLSAVNSTEVSVVAGEIAAVDALSERLAAGGVVCRRLAAAHAFHSTMMEPVAAKLADRFRGRRLYAPEIPFLSNVSGDWISAGEATDPEYWARHLCHTVRFADGLERLLRQGAVLLEVGPGHGLGTMALQHPADAAAAERIVIAALPGRFEHRDDQEFLLRALGRLWMAGVGVDWTGFVAGEKRRRVVLPTYPFERRRFAVEPGRRLPALAAGPRDDEVAAMSETTERPSPVPSDLHPRPALPTAYEAPADELEQGIAEIWQQLLGIAPVGIHDDYFDLGGNSLVGTVMLARLRQRFGLELGLERLFATPTVAGLAATIREEGGAEAEAALRPPIPGLPRDGRALPLSFAQERLWFLDRLAPDGSFYNLPSCWVLHGPLDVAALAASLSEIERRHDVLRTVFHTREGEPVQIVRACIPTERRLPVVDLSDLGVCARRAETRALIRAESLRPFDLECDPMLRTVLLRLRGEKHQLLLTLHHIAGDGWSWNVLLTELAAFYGTLTAARPAAVAVSPLPELPIRYADFAVWQRGWLKGEVLAAEIAWWRDQLAGAPVLELPCDRPRPALQRFRGRARNLHLPPAIADRLEALGRRHGATPFMTVKAAFDVLLWRVTGQRDLVVGTPIANRNHPGIEDLIGFFVNTLALRTRLPHGGATPFAELFAQVRDTALGAFAHQDLPFETLVEHLEPERDLSRNPIVQLLFALQNAPTPTSGLPGLSLGAPAFETESTRFDLEVHLWQRPQGLAMVFSFDRDLFDDSTITRWVQQYGRLLGALAEQPGRRLHELPLLDPGECHQLVVEWNDTLALGWGEGTCVHERFEAQVARTPEAVAVLLGEEQWTYRHLNAHANRLANYLRGLGVGPDVTVGVALERSPEAVAALVGVLKAGGVYVPLDRSYPAERLAVMLKDAGVEVLLTRAEGLAELPTHPAQAVLLDADREAIARASAKNPASGVGAENLSYMIYTSGSTGRPKGVALVHDTLANLIAWQLERPGFRAGARTLQFAALSFDVSLQEVASTLCSGGTLVLVTDDERRDPPRLIERLAAHGVERLFMPFVALQQLAEVAAHAPPAALREVITAGEQLQITRQVEHFFTHLPDCTLENQYGPSESHVVSVFRLAGGASAWPALPSIGRPVPNFRIYLLDADRQPVPPGVAGELFLSGAGLARGYYGRPDLTAERFLPDPLSGDPLSGDPFAGEPGARMYATGDLGRFATDGTIEFLGRIDHQIKIRGFRVELGEIEAILSRHPGVREAAVAVRGDAPGDRRLVAYVVSRYEPATAASELRSHLAAMLPDYMVPTVFVELEALPLLPSGKVNRRALPAPEPGAAAGERVAPRSPHEEILAGIWSQLLGLAEVGVHDDFFALGGHSLLATQVQSRIRRDLEVELPLRTFFEEPTVAGLATWVAEALRRQRGLEAPPLRPLPRRPGEGVALSFAQQRLWFIDRFEPGSATYNLPALFRLVGYLDHGALARALNEIVRRHEVLRTRFETVDGVPVQVIEPAAEVPLPEIDLSALAGPRRRAVADRLARREAQGPFDLDRGPVMRTVLLQLEAEGDREEHVLCLSVHHIAFDGWSISVFVGELETLYRAFAAGRSSALPELEVQYADFAVWQRQWLCGEVLEAQLGYWREQLANLPVLELPTDRPRPAVQSFRGDVAEFPLPPELYRRLQELGARRGTTLFMVLLAGFQALVGRYTGQRDFAVGTPVANRNRAETEGLIGFFVNTLVLRADLSADPEDGSPASRELSFAQLLARVREVALDAYAHQDLPFEKLVEELDPERNVAQNPLIQVLFALYYAPPAIGELEAGLRVSMEGVATDQAKFDLTLSLNEHAQGVTNSVEFNTDLFDVTTIRRLEGHLENLLEGAAADPEKRLSELPWLAAAAERQLLVEWNDTASDYPGELAIARLFELRAERAPEAVAVVFDHESLSYAELNRRANRLAHYLLARIAGGPEPMVALMMERSLDTVVAILAILKAGGVYVPLDLSYPPERLAFMLEDAEAPVLITEQAAAASLPADLGIEIVCLDRDAVAIARASDRNPVASAGGDQLAYVIYTSGSTGIPKGVAVSHRAVARLVFNTNYIALGPDDRVAQASTTSFDAATFELWGALVHGGRLVGIGKDVAIDPQRFPATLRERGITALFLTTALFNQMVREDPAAFATVRDLLFGGEAVDPQRVREALAGGPPERLLHVYGPTESTTFTTWYRVREVAAGARTVPIGGPLANTELYVVDRTLAPMPAGVAGELLIGGDGLARGYFKRPGLTAERFVPHPFAWGRGGECLYRTGDLVRYLPDGAIEFLGRLDFQVKVRGLRIELGEIEAVLGRHPAVREVVVVAAGPDPERPSSGDRRLVAYVVTDEPGATPAALREFLLRSLPDYMAPSAIVLLEALPLGPTGKVDRRALPVPEATSFALDEDFVPPRSPIEEMMVEIWGQVLPASESASRRISVHDDFFELGGHSLLATQLVSRIRNLFAIDLPLRSVFENPTLAGLAASCEQARQGEGALLVPPIEPGARDRESPRATAPLSFAQQRLWFLAQLEPENTAYNSTVPLRFAGRLDREAMRRTFGEIIRRHEVLRTTFALEGGEPVQVIAPAGEHPMPLVDLIALAAEDRQPEVGRLVRITNQRVVDLVRGPVFRTILMRLAEDDHVVVIVTHHIVFDGWSVAIVVRELVAFYKALLAGDEVRPDFPLSPLPVQYADFACWQRRWLRGEELERQLDWWREHLGSPQQSARLALDRQRREGEASWIGFRFLNLSQATSSALRRLTSEQGATLFMTMTAAFQTLLHRHTGAESVVIGTPIANRHRYEIESLVGFFVNTLALAGNFADDPPFRELLARLRESTLGAYAYQDLPFEKVVEALAPERSTETQPLFQAMFTFQNAPIPPLEMPGLMLRPLEGDTGRRSPLFDLVLGMGEQGEYLFGSLDYDASLFEEATIDALSDHFQRLLEEIVADPDRRVGDLRLMSEVERREILAERSFVDPGGEVWAEIRKRLGSLLPGVVETVPRLYLLDRKLRPVPSGGRGEIYLENVGAVEVSGAAAAAAILRPHPFAEESGRRLLATPLRGRWRSDGRLELEPEEVRPEAESERREPTVADRVSAELEAADELRSEFTTRQQGLSDARRALLAQRLRGRSKKASTVEGR